MGVCVTRNLHTVAHFVIYKLRLPGDVNDSLSLNIFYHSFIFRKRFIPVELGSLSSVLSLSIR